MVEESDWAKQQKKMSFTEPVVSSFTVSYALDRSMYIARVGCFRFIYLCSLSIMVWSASVVLELGLKAYCVGEMILCLVRWFISCLFMMVSNTFAIIGSNDMGR